MYFSKQYKELNTEFYTQEKYIQMLTYFLDMNKKYIEPFDRNGNSKIYKELKEYGFDIISLNHDFNPNEDYKGRIIITNPPFISRLGLFSKMSRMCSEMYVIMPVFSYNCYTKYRKKDKCKRWIDNWNCEKLFEVNTFDSPDGEKKVNCVWVKLTKNRR